MKNEALQHVLWNCEIASSHKVITQHSNCHFPNLYQAIRQRGKKAYVYCCIFSCIRLDDISLEKCTVSENVNRIDRIAIEKCYKTMTGYVICRSISIITNISRAPDSNLWTCLPASVMRVWFYSKLYFQMSSCLPIVLSLRPKALCPRFFWLIRPRLECVRIDFSSRFANNFLSVEVFHKTGYYNCWFWFIAWCLHKKL